MIKISEIDINNIDAEILEFAPLECMSCEYDDYIPIRYFLVEPPIETEAEHEELKRLVKSQLGYHDFCSTSCDKGQLISVTRCPQCSSEDIFMDF